MSAGILINEMIGETRKLVEQHWAEIENLARGYSSKDGATAMQWRSRQVRWVDETHLHFAQLRDRAVTQ